MKKLLLLTLYILLPLATVRASELDITRTQAFEAYSNEQYDKAVELYSQLADSVQNVDVYYNLGCSYFRADSLAKSILWFERALRLDPTNEDVRFNLNYVRSKTVDKIATPHEKFLVAFYDSLVLKLTVNQWGYFSVACFIGALVLMLVYIFSHRLLWRKLAFGFCIVFILLTVFGNLFAMQRGNTSESTNRAIVMTSSLSVKSMPGSGDELFVLHEGTCVTLKGDIVRDWCKVELTDGKVGWVQLQKLEKI